MRGMTRAALYLVKHVLHWHKEALSLVQSKFVVLVVATCKNAGNVRNESTPVISTSTVTHHHVVTGQRHFHRLAAAIWTTLS